MSGRLEAGGGGLANPVEVLLRRKTHLCGLEVTHHIPAKVGETFGDRIHGGGNNTLE